MEEDTNVFKLAAFVSNREMVYDWGNSYVKNCLFEPLNCYKLKNRVVNQKETTRNLRKINLKL